MARSSTERYLDTDFPNLSTKENDGRKGNGNVRVKSDKETGNYEVKQKTDAGETTIYTYDAPTNKFNISDSSLYSKFFTGQEGNDQKVRLDTQVKGATVDAALKDIPNSALGGTDELEISFDKMLDQDGYLGFSNTLDLGFGFSPEDFESTFGSEPGDWTKNIDPNFLSFDTSINLFDDLDIKSSFSGSDPNKTARAISFQTGKTFVYPETMPDIGYDFIKFTSYKYVPAGLQVIGKSSAAERIFKDKITEIMLPMLPNISESNSVDWGGDKANALQLMLGNRAMQAIESIGNLSVEQFMQAIGGTIEDFKNLAKDPSVGPAIAAYFAGQAVGANVFTRATGTVLNPNLELLFNGPTLRTFNFNFRLTPRTRTESVVVKNIIKSFKRNMAAQRSESDLFLLTPNVYKIEYIYGGLTPPSIPGPHPYMNKIKPCALRNFNVNYGPDGAYMTYPDGSMTCYEIQLQFGELEPIYADEIKQEDDNMSY
tara:strand:+ start:9051 stop:10505 length:1455 start_codon:yes stop_codon:yes gene_type:complete